MNALDDIEKAMRMLRDRGAEMKAFEGLLTEISSALADILGALEKPKAEKENEYGPLVAAIKGLSLKMDAPKVDFKAPDITVNVPEQKAPVINFTPPGAKKLNLRIKVERGANGMATSYAISEV